MVGAGWAEASFGTQSGLHALLKIPHCIIVIHREHLVQRFGMKFDRNVDLWHITDSQVIRYASVMQKRTSLTNIKCLKTSYP